MTEVWKSQGRKFCDICKVWFGDNKASIEHHERGKKHKDALEMKLRELGKASRKKEKMESKMSSTLEAMEAAALVAMRQHGEGLSHGPALPATGIPAPKVFDPKQFKDVASMAREMARRKQEEMLQGKRGGFGLDGIGIPDAKMAKMEEPEFQPDPQLIRERIDEHTVVERYAPAPQPDPYYPVASSSQPVEQKPEYEGRVWVEAELKDGSGRKYYWHMYNASTTWEMPQCYYTAEEYSVKLVEIEMAAKRKRAAEKRKKEEEEFARIVKEEEEAMLREEAEAAAAAAGEDIDGVPMPDVDPSMPETIPLPDEMPMPKETRSTEEPVKIEPKEEVLEEEPTPVPQPPEPEPELDDVAPAPILSTGIGGWTKVKPRLDEPPAVSPLTARYRAEEERERKEAEERNKYKPVEEKIIFEEKTTATITKKVKGPIEFKKKSAAKNIRKREE